ncbi:MAG: putative zinc-binding protein [Promethearchaeota archaeon]
MKYVGLLACSGEEIPGGTVTRIAARKVFEKYLPEETIAICFPLFLSGEEGEREFVRKFPSIAIDGCEKRCVARNLEKLGLEPAAEFVVPEFFTPEEGESIESGPLHDLEWKDHPLCEKLALAVAHKVKEINEKKA